MFGNKASRFIPSIFVVLALTVSTLQAQSRLDTIRERIESRTFPSIFGPWLLAENRDDLGLSVDDARALYDIRIINNMPQFHWYYRDGNLRRSGSLLNAQNLSQRWMRGNPDQVIIFNVFMRSAYHPPTNIPPFQRVDDDFPYWVRDANGNPVSGWPGTYLLDFTHPDMQDLIVEQVVQAAESELYDGVFFDYWSEHWTVLNGYRTYAQEQAARRNILRRIREEVHPDFLVIVNLNDRITEYPEWINGSYMETYFRGGQRQYTRADVIQIEESLRWLDENTRQPRFNCLEAISWPAAYRTSEAQSWLRLFTTLSLTHSNGAVLYSHSNRRHDWHPFWAVDIGKPVSPKSQQVEGQGRFGCFIREFENGWAVYNRSRKTQVIELPSVATAVSTGKPDYIHEVPSMDGEIFVKSHSTRVHPRDLLTPTWGKMKNFN